MIKVNFLRGLEAPIAVSGIDFNEAQAMTPETQKQAGLRLAVMLVLPLALFGYEKMTLSELDSRHQAVRSEIAEIEARRESLGDAAPKYEKFSKELKKIEGEMADVREIARNRLREVKTLDQLQNLRPPSAWFSSIKIDGNVVRVKGYSNTDEGVAGFIKALDTSGFFSKVEPKSTGQERTETGTIRTFDVEFRVGQGG